MYVALDTIISQTEVFKPFNFGETIKEFVGGVGDGGGGGGVENSSYLEVTLVCTEPNTVFSVVLNCPHMLR